jgi:hypothetical protein
MAQPVLDIHMDWRASTAPDFNYSDGGGDITVDMTSATWTRGTNFDGSTDSPGTCVLTVKNADQKYDPKNSGSSLYGAIHPGPRLHIRATYGGTTYGLYYGYLRRIILQPLTRTAELHFEDQLYALGREETTVVLSTTRSLADFRGAILDDIGEASNRRDLASGVEIDTPMTAGNGVSALGKLTDCNRASGSVHWCAPTDGAGGAGNPPYVYRVRERVELLTGSPLATYNASSTGVSIDSYDLTDEAIINGQRVTASITGFSGEPEVLWTAPMVPFVIPASSTIYLWADVGAARSVTVAYVATGTVTTGITQYDTSALVSLTVGGTAVTVTELTVSGQRGVAANVSAWSDDVGSKARALYGPLDGSEISTSLVSGLSMAQGLANSIVYRYKTPRTRPNLTLVNTWPDQLSRDLCDRIAVTSTRLSLSAVPYLIRSLTTTVNDGLYWTTSYKLEEVPTGGNWVTIGGTADQGVGGSAILAY